MAPNVTPFSAIVITGCYASTSLKALQRCTVDCVDKVMIFLINSKNYFRNKFIGSLGYGGGLSANLMRDPAGNIA